MPCEVWVGAACGAERKQLPRRKARGARCREAPGAAGGGVQFSSPFVSAYKHHRCKQGRSPTEKIFLSHQQSVVRCRGTPACFWGGGLQQSICAVRAPGGELPAFLNCLVPLVCPVPFGVLPIVEEMPLRCRFSYPVPLDIGVMFNRRLLQGGQGGFCSPHLVLIILDAVKYALIFEH